MVYIAEGESTGSCIRPFLHFFFNFLKVLLKKFLVSST